MRRIRIGLIVPIALVAPLVLVSSGASVHRSASVRGGLASLPAAAQGPISAALGRDDAAYRVSGLHAENPTQRLRAAFSRRGVVVSSDGGRIGLALSAYGYPGMLVRLASVAPRASANRVTYAHGPLTEWYASGPLGLEQGFSVATRPTRASGPLTLSLALSGNLSASRDHGDVLLSRRGHALRYGGLHASDARGHVLRSWLQIVKHHLLVRVDDRGARYPVRVDPLIQQARLTAGDGRPGDALGFSIATSGNTVVVGAPNHQVGENPEQGAVYVFVERAGGWADTEQAAELTASDGGQGDLLGGSVAISGDTVLAGARLHNVGANAEQGAAYVFSMPSGGWAPTGTQTAELRASDGAAGDEFGYSVAISGETIAVGAEHAKIGTNFGQGAAYVFVRPPTGWATAGQNARLTASDGESYDGLGSSVAVSGNTVVAGAWGDKIGANSGQGAGYVFVMPPSGWINASQNAELTASNGAAQDALGASAAMSGNTVILGAPLRQVGTDTFQGAVYLYVMPPSGWMPSVFQNAFLTASDGEADDFFGDAIAIDGDTVLIGADGHEISSSKNQGAGYVYVKPPSGWPPEVGNQSAELSAGGNEPNEIGASVAISGETIALGAPHTAGLGPASSDGAAYVFDEPPSIAIETPTDGATYTLNQALTAAYACTAPAGTVVTACVGPVASGAAFDTHTLGQHTFVVEAETSAGAAVTRTASYTVLAPLAHLATAQKLPLVGTAPILSGASQTAKTWREANRLPHISTSRRAKRPPVGTTFSFTVSEQATVTLAFTQQTAERRVHGRCVVSGARNRRKPRCTRTVTVGTFALHAHQGINRIRFAGRISRTRKLKPGRFTVQLTATNAQGQRSTPHSLSFTIVK